MTERGQIYKCQICGNIVEVIHSGQGSLVCCGKEMELMEEKTADSSTEKHVPFIQYQDDHYIVKVGENINHPMEEKHYIEWIELIVDDNYCKKYLKPNQEPKAEFFIPKGEKVYAREYCNIHGLWKSKK